MNNCRRLTTVSILNEVDVVTCRQSAKKIAAWLGLSNLEQIRLATAVSELARNIYQYANTGAFHFDLLRDNRGLVNAIAFEAVDQGKGITEIDAILNGTYVSPTGMGVGLSGAQKLTDSFDIQTSPQGTRIYATKAVYPPRPFPGEKQIQAIRQQLASEGAADPYVELQVRGSELLLTTAELQNKQRELEATNEELENTNKGVVALYSELEKAAHELTEASESKSRFFSNMTHEFRTPINIIENISKLLISETDGTLNAEQAKQMKFISSAAAELSDMVNELLDLAEADSGRMDAVASRFTLGEFLADLHDFMGPLSIRYPSVRWEIAPGNDDLVLDTDRSRLFQILRNLISNAFKYTPEGEITVRSFMPDEGTVEFSVQDTGVGISEENLSRIFEEFARVRMPGLQVQGNGLGLPLASRLAALLRGEIEVTSTVGKGSRFSARVARELRQAERDPGHLSLEGMTVLIIDDSEGDRYLLRHLLEPYGAIILEAHTAGSSIDKLHALRPDVIFLDLDLPDFYGGDLLDSMDWAMHSRVLINTAKSLTDVELAHLRQHCAGVLLKSQADYAPTVLRHVQRLTGGYHDEN